MRILFKFFWNPPILCDCFNITSFLKIWESVTVCAKMDSVGPMFVVQKHQRSPNALSFKKTVVQIADQYAETCCRQQSILQIGFSVVFVAFVFNVVVVSPPYWIRAFIPVLPKGRRKILSCSFRGHISIRKSKGKLLIFDCFSPWQVLL